MTPMTNDSPRPITEGDEDDDGFVFVDATPEPPPQVSSYIAIIRIVAVLGMGLCVSFGLFIMLVGLQGIIIGVPIVLLAIPCYYGMQFAERLALRAEGRAVHDTPEARM
ncbi:MAG TPA: hypothetical protein VEZ14_05075 [Dehalococcoidia bacterium]|nr:hypothetical protein [Dehalococcoidia bacterium]